MKAVCTKDPKHVQFLTTAHVTQTWLVDAEGEFLEEVSTDDVTHPPDVGNSWCCATCGAEADVTAC